MLFFTFSNPLWFCKINYLLQGSTLLFGKVKTPFRGVICFLPHLGQLTYFLTFIFSCRIQKHRFFPSKKYPHWHCQCIFPVRLGVKTKWCYDWFLREKECLKRDWESSWAQTLADSVASQAWCFVYIYFFILKMEKKKTLDVRIPNMNLVPKWAFLGVNPEKKSWFVNWDSLWSFFSDLPQYA